MQPRVVCLMKRAKPLISRRRYDVQVLNNSNSQSEAALELCGHPYAVMAKGFALMSLTLAIHRKESTAGAISSHV